MSIHAKYKAHLANPATRKGVLWSGWTRPLLRRLRDDDEFAGLLDRSLSADGEHRESEIASTARLMAAARGLSDQSRRWCIAEIDRQLQTNVVARAGFDALAGAVRPLSDALTDAIGAL